MRGEQLARQWRIIRLLESRRNGLTAAQIAQELDSPPRTVYRDLDALQQAGFPLYTERIDGYSHWKLIEGFKKDFPFPFTATELMSLHMGRDLMKVLEGTVFHESIESLFEKIKAALPPATVQYLDQLSGAFGAGFGPSKKLAQCKETISLASDAVSNRRQVEITYKALSTSQETRRRVDPYRVWAMNGALYLIGLCHLRNEVRTFAIDRITALDVLQESFRAPKDFSLSDYLQSAFRVMRGEPKVIKVRFSPGAAQVVRERIWHPSQEIREKPDGSVILTLEAPINYEVTSWILGFGSAAKVLKPQSLQDKILRELEASLTRYSSWSHSRTKVAPAKKIVAALS